VLEELDRVGQLKKSDVQHASRAQDLGDLGRLRAYQDVSEATNIDVGTSYLMGHNDAVPGRVSV
jgi:hypothetical protein